MHLKPARVVVAMVSVLSMRIHAPVRRIVLVNVAAMESVMMGRLASRVLMIVENVQEAAVFLTIRRAVVIPQCLLVSAPRPYIAAM